MALEIESKEARNVPCGQLRILPKTPSGCRTSGRGRCPLFEQACAMHRQLHCDAAARSSTRYRGAAFSRRAPDPDFELRLPGEWTAFDQRLDRIFPPLWRHGDSAFILA